MKQLLSILAIATIIFSSSCKKKDPEVVLDTQIQQFNNDANNVKGESDYADQDINTSMQNTSLGNKTEAIVSSPLCGVTIDSSQISNKILFYNFDGVTPCFSPTRTRSGQIKVQLTTGNHWGDVGSVLTLTYTAFKVTRSFDNKSIQFDGVKTLKNINGTTGWNWLNFYLGNGTLKFQERALGVQVTFDNNAHATWNSARMTEWSFESSTSKLTFSATGDTSFSSSYTQVDCWGTNRFNQPFITRFTQPWVSNSYCGFWRPISGIVNHHVNNSDYTLTLGVDQSGNPTSLNCAYGFKVSWTGGSVVLSY